MFSERLKRLSPYVPGEQPQDKTYIKLNTNENPYPPSPEIRDLLRDFSIERLRLYPDPQSKVLCQTIAKAHNVDVEQVFVGNGSDEVLSFVFYAFFDSAMGKLLFPEFTYSFYPVYCDYYGIDYKKIQLNDDYSLSTEGFLNETSCGIIFPNPNAPTGILFPIKKIEQLMKKYPKDRVVVIDEAYIDFGGESAIGLISRFKNLLVARTYSKSMSLAGLRLGYAIGDEKLINALVAAKDSFNSYPVDTLTQKIGEVAIKDSAYYEKINGKIIKTREFLTSELKSLGWEVLPSTANFIFMRKKGLPGKEIYLTLKKNGLLVRYFDIDGIKDFVRITIGQQEDVETLLGKIKKLDTG